MEQLKTDQLERVNSVDAIEEILKGFDFDLIEKLYFNNLSFLNPQDRISAQYMLYLRYNDHSDKIPVEKKPLFAIRSSVLQTGFNIENLGQTYRVRTQGDINIAENYKLLQFDVFGDYDAGARSASGQMRLRFPLPGLKNLELLHDIRIKDNGDVEGLLGINSVIKKSNNVYQIGLGINQDKHVVITSRTKTVYGSFGIKNILSFDIQTTDLSLRQDFTYDLLNRIALLLSVKTKSNLMDLESSLKNTEINIAVGFQYTF